MAKQEISSSVIRRLPRYRRFLGELQKLGVARISSKELSEQMGLTASQIRQDLNCFGGFGQQGYGYNVSYLYAKICELLGVGAGIRAIVIGAGDLGRALVRSSMFEKRGVDLVGLFDVNPELIGRTVEGINIYDIERLEDFCAENPVDMAVLTLPKDETPAVVERLRKNEIHGFWNFTGADLHFAEDDSVVEDVHLGDSLMSLNYRLCHADLPESESKESKKKK